MSRQLLDSGWGRASVPVALTRPCAVRRRATCNTICGTPLLLVVIRECFEKGTESRFDVESVPNPGAKELLVNFVEGSRFDGALTTLLVTDDLAVSEGSLNGKGLLAGAADTAWVPGRTGLCRVL
ncbi:hypothetical protein DFH09DRAFT_1320029 [Mycena vulgaris]|nr:hypothetical protein DFH09DRAFT_1320029 [Mycena vulgaris]